MPYMTNSKRYTTQYKYYLKVKDTEVYKKAQKERSCKSYLKNKEKKRQKYLENRKIIKNIYVKDKLINLILK